MGQGPAGTIAQQDWGRVDDALDQVLDIPEPQRDAWIDRFFANAPGLARRTRHLLAREIESRPLFDRLSARRDDILAAAMSDAPDARADPRIDRHYGPWKIVGHLGSGGMAEVYEVCRDDGRYAQRAALKIMRSGVLGDAARALFIRERRLLATLDHPGIVRIIDGGETATGAPWLVMDLIEGEPIDAYCDRTRADWRTRLSLIAEAADALQAAHGRLILHGDLKADHVVVLADGSVRLLDFGIAQALDDHGRAQVAAAISPRSASPEQHAGAALTVSSDIFQLGTLLERLTKDCAESRDLRAVIDRATAADPAERYSAAATLADDLRAVIAGRATLALPDTRIRALIRSVRQNRVAATLVATLVIGSIGWATDASLSAAAIERQRQAALTAADKEKRGKQVLLDLFRRSDLLQADSPGIPPEASIRLVDNLLADARIAMRDDPVLLAELIGSAARTHERADDLAGALELASEAERLSRGASEHRHASALAYWAALLIDSGERKRGEAQMARALEEIAPEDPPDLASTDALLSAAWAKAGDWQAQIPLFIRVRDAGQAIGDVNAEIEARSGLGRAYTDLGRYDAADAEIRASLALVERHFGADHPRMALPLSDLGRLADHRGDYSTAIDAHRRALAISLASLGPTASTSLTHRNNLAIALMDDGQIGAASDELERLLEARRSLDPSSLDTADTAQNLAAALVRSGRLGEADAPLDLAERIFAARLPSANPKRVFPALTRSELRLAQHRYSEAEQAARIAFAALSDALPAGHYATETARCRIGIALLRQGRVTSARGYLQAAYAAMTAANARVPEAYLAPCRAARSEL